MRKGTEVNIQLWGYSVHSMFLALCNNMTHSQTCTGGSVATATATGSGSEIATLRGTLGLFLQAIGSGMSLHPYQATPSPGTILRLAQPYGNASAIYSRTGASCKPLIFF